MVVLLVTMQHRVVLVEGRATNPLLLDQEQLIKDTLVVMDFLDHLLTVAVVAVGLVQ